MIVLRILQLNKYSMLIYESQKKYVHVYILIELL